MIGVLVCVDRISRFTMLEPLRSRNVTDIILALEAVFNKNGMPRILLTDQESSILSLARAQGWYMAGSGFMFGETSELACFFTPASPSGHSRNGVAERTIKSIKKAIGGTDFTAAKIDLFSFNQLLINLATKLNNLPIANKGKRGMTVGLENILTPDILFKGLRFHPICLPQLSNGSLNHTLRKDLAVTQNILASFVIEHFSSCISSAREKVRAEPFQVGTIVGFFQGGNDRIFKRCYDSLKIGQVEILTDYENGLPRSAILRFVTLSGTPAISSKIKVFVTKRKLSDLICLIREKDELESSIDEDLNMMEGLLGKENSVAQFVGSCKKTLSVDSRTRELLGIEHMAIEPESFPMGETWEITPPPDQPPTISLSVQQDSTRKLYSKEVELKEVMTAGRGSNNCSEPNRIIENGSKWKRWITNLPNMFLLFLFFSVLLETTNAHYESSLILISAIEGIRSSNSFRSHLIEVNQAKTSENKFLLTALACGGQKKFFDLTYKTKCNESTFSSYHQGFQTEKTFMHVPSKIQIQSLTCTVRVKISNALCNRQKNVNKILGTGQKVSNFKMSSDQFILVSPKECHNSQIEGRLDLKLGPDKIPLTGIRGEETHFEIYLGGSSLNLQNGFIECDSVTKRVFMSKNKPNELMGGNIVKADITLTIKYGKADFLMRDDLLLTNRGEKIIFDEKYSQVKLTPFFPTVVDKMSMLLFYFPTDYRTTKLFNFGKFEVLQFNSVNGSSPSLLRLALKGPNENYLTAALQLADPFMGPLENTKLGGDTCLQTQFADLVICTEDKISGLDAPQSLLTLQNFLRSKDAGETSFLQQNIDHSVSGILLNLCLQTAGKMQIAATNFEQLGNLIRLQHTGVPEFTSESLGEVGSVQSCSTTVVQATAFRSRQGKGNIICCTFLPIIYQNGIRFLKPLSRELTDTCVVEKCTGPSALSRLYISLGGHVIRQSATGITRLNFTNITNLDPSSGLDSLKLKQLDISELRQPDLDIQTHIRVRLAGEIFDDLTAGMAERFNFGDEGLSTELARELLPAFVFFMIHTEAGQILLLIIVLCESWRLLMILMSFLCMIIEFLRKKPVNTLEWVINQSTASRREQREINRCSEEVHQKLITDIRAIGRQAESNQKDIENLSRAERRAIRDSHHFTFGRATSHRKRPEELELLSE